jgi:Tol biopolymer transport system component
VRRIKGQAAGPDLVYLDLQHAAEAEIIPASQQLSGIDWSPQADVLVFSALRAGAVTGGAEDLYRVDPNGQNSSDLSCASAGTGAIPTCDPSPTAGSCSCKMLERRPRIDPSGSVAVYQRVDTTGLGQIFVFENSLTKLQVTSGGTPGPSLRGTPFVVGTDADPAYSPDGQSIVFRRLTGLGQGGLGTWDIMTVHADGSAPFVVATGPLYRGAPDWGTPGLVFAETDLGTGTTSLVAVQPDGSGRHTLLSQAAGFNLSFPRWLPGAP